MARFGSEEQQADISVSIRGANTLKLTFLQIKDVTEFGDVVEAAPLFVPPGAKLISSTSRTEPQLNNAGGGPTSIPRPVYSHHTFSLNLRLDRGNYVLFIGRGR